jgi:predicted Zn finger-like uncharacterized protein
MRLVCPNCEAKYEVPEDAIPDIGRDVQCANCGHSWFQMRPRPASAVADPAPAAEVEPAAAEPVSVAAEVQPEAPAAEHVVAEAVPTAEDVTSAEAIVVEDVVAVTEPEDTHEPTVAEVAAEAAPEIEPEPASVQLDDSAALAEADIPTISDAVEETDSPTIADAVAEMDSPTIAGAEADDLPASQSTEAEPEVILAAEADTASTAEADLDADAALVADPEDEPEEEANAAPALAAAAAAAYAVDESVLAILREEAEREAQARRAEARPLESQTDLGLDAAMPGRSKPALVATNGAVMDSDGDASLKPSARRDLLPDVEEINSTLRPSEVPTEDFIQSGPPQSEARGFRSGFLMVMTVAIIGAAIYTAAPRLSIMVPALAGALETYVGVIDSLRLSLDGIMQSATVAINGS